MYTEKVVRTFKALAITVTASTLIELEKYIQHESLEVYDAILMSRRNSTKALAKAINDACADKCEYDIALVMRILIDAELHREMIAEMNCTN